MPRYERRIWEPDPTAYPPLRRIQQGFAYEAFVPDPLTKQSWTLATDVAAELVRAEVAVVGLNALPPTSGVEAMSRFLLQAESISSSQIEGLVVSQRKLAQALFDPRLATEMARSIVGNILAMERAVQLGSRADPITVADICSIHRELLWDTPHGSFAGKLRTEQTWIGGRLNAPLDAEYIPPPPEHIPGLMEDLARFCGRDDLPAVLQAALVHAQFETIHPFADGNGRVGRALIHVILRRRGTAAAFLPPVSNVLAANAHRYVAGLTAFREGDIAGWVQLFAQAMQTTADRAGALAAAIRHLQAAWMGRVAGTRAHATVRKLIEILPGTPVLDARRASEMTGSSTVSARKALEHLQEVGAVRLLKSDARRGKVWVADEFLGMLNAFEWDLAGPTPMTYVEPSTT